MIIRTITSNILNPGRFLFSFLAFFFLLSLSCNAQRLSNQAKVSLLTYYPGEDLYSTFGHSAFLIYDPSRGIDRVYNYGTFDFRESNFYLKFIRGKLPYQISVSDINTELWVYEQEDREVVEQVLNLSLEEKNGLLNFLEDNYLPENRYYKYDFFFDNCASRLRDALKKVCSEDLKFHQVDKHKSYRQLIDPFLADKQWQDFGMDTGLGTPADSIAIPYNYMFLPIHLMNAFDSATINSNGKEEKLVISKNILYKQRGSKIDESLFTPDLIFWSLFLIVLVITILQFKNSKSPHFLDALFFVSTGLLGFLIVFLWFGTDHKVTVQNWNIIWAMPLNLFVIFFRRNSQVRSIKYYYLVYGICLTLLLLLWNLIPQEINMATFPFILTMALRSFFIYYKLKTSKAV